MDKEVKAVRKEKLVISYSVKELIGALHKKIDRIESELVSGAELFSEIQTAIRYHKIAIYGLYGAFFALLLVLLELKGVI